MTSIEITNPDPETRATRFVVDGIDMSRATRSVSIDITGGGRPRVRAEFLTVEHIRMSSTDAILEIPDEVSDYLVAQGWQRPYVSQCRHDPTCAVTCPATVLTRMADLESQYVERLTQLSEAVAERDLLRARAIHARHVLSGIDANCAAQAESTEMKA